MKGGGYGATTELCSMVDIKLWRSRGKIKKRFFYCLSLLLEKNYISRKNVITRYVSFSFSLIIFT